MTDVSFAESLNEKLSAIDSIVWGPFLLIPLLLGTGLFLTIRLVGIQFRYLAVALRHGLIDRNDDGGEGDISQYQALTTALAATVGVGNIVGVALSIHLGGPGALFWMWITALVGMVVSHGHVQPIVGFISLLMIAIGAGASGCLNMWWDADIDAVMTRTAKRPIPDGRIRPDEALAFGIVLFTGAKDVTTLPVLIYTRGIVTFDLAGAGITSAAARAAGLPPLEATANGRTEAGQRLADILDEEAPDVVVGYDWHGGYGHPDHVKVHPVMHRALELTRATPRLFESTMNRDRMRVMYRKAVEAGVYPEGEGFNPDQPMDDGNPLGLPEREISFYVDVTPWLESKRAALAAHASQSDARGILEMPDEVFPLAFGREHYVDVAAMEASGIPSLDGHAHGARPDGEPLPEGWFF